MIKGKTSSGFEYSVNEKIVEDWRIAEAMADCSSSDDMKRTLGAVSLVRMILGDQEDGLIASVTGKDGIAKTEDIIKNVSEILTEIGERNQKIKN